MGSVRKNELTQKERLFSNTYAETNGNILYSMKMGGYPVTNKKAALTHANYILMRPRVKAYLRKLWNKAESPIVMLIRERLEILSELARGTIGSVLDENGEVDLEAIKNNRAVREVVINDWRSTKVEGLERRTVRIKMSNPVEAIHHINLMQKLYRSTEGAGDGKTVNNYYVTSPEVVEKIARIGERTRPQLSEGSGDFIDVTPVETIEENSEND